MAIVCPLESHNFNALRRKEGLGCQFELLVDQFGNFGCATPDEFAGSVVIVLALHLHLHKRNKGTHRMKANCSKHKEAVVTS